MRNFDDLWLYRLGFNSIYIRNFPFLRFVSNFFAPLNSISDRYGDKKTCNIDNFPASEFRILLFSRFGFLATELATNIFCRQPNLFVAIYIFNCLNACYTTLGDWTYIPFIDVRVISNVHYTSELVWDCLIVKWAHISGQINVF